jgi:hypothetical protein
MRIAMPKSPRKIAGSIAWFAVCAGISALVLPGWAEAQAPAAAPAAAPAKTTTKAAAPAQRGAKPPAGAAAPAGKAEDPKVTVERGAGGRKVYRITEAMQIEGKIQKPEAFYVLQKSSINYDWQDLKQDFIPKIVESVAQAPF